MQKFVHKRWTKWQKYTILSNIVNKNRQMWITSNRGSNMYDKSGRFNNRFIITVKLK